MEIKKVYAHKSNYSHKTSNKTGIVFHWIVGEQSAADATFRNPTRNASAHYSISSNGIIHRHVDDKYIAWHAGNNEANKKYIGIEHAGGQLINGRRKVPTRECHEASIRLCTYLCRKYGFSLKRGDNAFKHNDVSKRYTECSGSLDIDYIIKEVNKNLNVNNNNMNFDQELKQAIEWQDNMRSKYEIQLIRKLGNETITRDELLIILKRYTDYLQKTPHV